MNRTKSENHMDMLQGSLLDKIILFALPLAASSILQQLFNAVDVAVVGRFASSRALAAVGSNTAVISLLVNMFVGVSMGANVLIASYIGKKENEGIHRAIHTAAILAAAAGTVLLVTGLFIARPVLTLMKTPDNVIDLAVLYLRIYCLGMPFIMVYNFGAAILRSMGDTKRPLYCLILSGIINTLLNLVLVIVFHLGVAGVAIATVVSNVVSAGLVVYFLLHENPPFRLRFQDIKIYPAEMVKTLKIGIPAGLQGMVFPLANMVIQSAINEFGSDVMAGSTAAQNYEYMTYFVINAFAQTAVTFTSQNYAAGYDKRCKKVLKETLLAGCLSCLVLSLVFVLGKKPFISVFTSDAKVAEFAYVRMMHVMLFEFLTGTYEITGAALRGKGYSMTPAFLTIFGTCLLRPLWVATVCRKYHTFGVLMSVYPVSWVLTGVLMAAAYIVIQKYVMAKSVKP